MSGLRIETVVCKSIPHSCGRAIAWADSPLPWPAEVVGVVYRALAAVDSPTDRGRPALLLERAAVDPHAVAPTAYFKTDSKTKQCSVAPRPGPAHFHSRREKQQQQQKARQKLQKWRHGYLNCVRRIVSCLVWFSSTSCASRDALWLASCKSLRSFSHSRRPWSTASLKPKRTAARAFSLKIVLDSARKWVCTSPEPAHELLFWIRADNARHVRELRTRLGIFLPTH